MSIGLVDRLKSRLDERTGGKLASFWYLLDEAEGPSDKLQVACLLPAAHLLPRMFGEGSPVAEMNIGFHAGRVHFRAHTGELTPYQQIKRDIDQGKIPVAKEDWVVIDGGANIGLFSLIAARRARVVAVEPNPDACRRLEVNLRQNGIRGSAVNRALSSSRTQVRMNFSREMSVLARVGVGDDVVESTTLDLLAEEHGLEHIDLLKLDVEGHEIDVLRGASRLFAEGRVRRAYLEANSEAEGAALVAHLAPHGLRLVHNAGLNLYFVLDGIDGH